MGENLITVYKGFERCPDDRLRSILKFWFDEAYTRESGRKIIDQLSCVYTPGKHRKFKSPRFVYKGLTTASEHLRNLFSRVHGTVEIWRCVTTHVAGAFVPELAPTRLLLRNIEFGPYDDAPRYIVMDLKLIEKERVYQL